MSYGTLEIVASILPTWLAIGALIGVYQVVSHLGLYFSAGFRILEMARTVVAHMVMWPLVLLPASDKEPQKDRDAWMNSTKLKEMDARWFLLRMSEGESLDTLSRRYEIPREEMRSLIFRQAIEVEDESSRTEDDESLDTLGGGYRPRSRQSRAKLGGPVTVVGDGDVQGAAAP